MWNNIGDKNNWHLLPCRKSLTSYCQRWFSIVVFFSLGLPRAPGLTFVLLLKNPCRCHCFSSWLHIVVTSPREAVETKRLLCTSVILSCNLWNPFCLQLWETVHQAEPRGGLLRQRRQDTSLRYIPHRFCLSFVFLSHVRLLEICRCLYVSLRQKNKQ